MKTLARLALPIAYLLLAACGGGGDGGGNPPAPNPPVAPPPPGTIGPAGGTVTGPNGIQVVIPAGALAQNVVIIIEQSSAGSPAMPANVIAAGQMFALLPHGTTFAIPATITVPFDPTLLAPGQSPELYKTNAAQNGWEQIAVTNVNGSLLTASINSFSHILASRPQPLEARDEPKRWYEFSGWNLENRMVHVEGNMVDGEVKDKAPVPPGILDEKSDFGLPPTLPQGGPDYPTAEVYSSENGHTYWVGTESPNGELLAQIPEDTYVGSVSTLRQDQSYRKNADNATLEIKITQVTLELADYNGTTPTFAACPWLEAENNDASDCNDSLDAGVLLWVQVLEGSGAAPATAATMLSSVEGDAYLISSSGEPAEFKIFGNPHHRDFTSEGPVEYPQNRPLFKKSDFVEVGNTQTRKVTLRQPLPVSIDLSRVPTCDENKPLDCKEFTVRIRAVANAGNRRVGETYARAWLRDPLNFGGAVEVTTTGLTPTNRPLSDDTQIAIPDLPECENGSQSEAGTVQFTATHYRIMEFGQLAPRIQLERTGGSTGRVIVTVTSRDDSAHAGTHYLPYARTFIFNDGDDIPRSINLQTVDDHDDNGNVSLDLVLTARSECATLGNPAVAHVTLVDNEARPLPNNNPSGSLDASFGTAGKVTTAPFGGNDSKMLRQPDGKIVIVGGTFTDFVLERFNSDGSPDMDFGSAGRVTTDIAGSFLQERARAVAIQPDGKLVVAGESTLPNNNLGVALVRYNSNGTLDASFSTDGKVLDERVPGRAFAVAIQADGKIVVAGDTPVPMPTTDYGDVLVARFNADGTPDNGFGSSGSSIFDVVAGTDLARNVVIQPNGYIVVNGDPIGTQTDDRTAVARLDASGHLDGSFSGDGRLMINSARLGRGLALQADGKLLLAGGTQTFPSSFALARLNADGSYDSGFGNGGAVTASLTHATSGSGDIATSVALRPDGRIYVAGIAGSINKDFGLVRFTTAGQLDTTFAGTGSLTVDFGGLEDGAESVAIEPGGKILLGGYATPTSSDGYGLVRVNP